MSVNLFAKVSLVDYSRNYFCNSPILADDDCSRERTAESKSNHVCCGCADPNRKVDLGFFDELQNFAPVLDIIGRRTDDLNSECCILVLDCRKVRHLGFAWNAVSGPEIQDYNPAFLTSQNLLNPGQVLQLQLSFGPDDLRRLLLCDTWRKHLQVIDPKFLLINHTKYRDPFTYELQPVLSR